MTKLVHRSHRSKSVTHRRGPGRPRKSRSGSKSSRKSGKHRKSLIMENGLQHGPGRPRKSRSRGSHKSTKSRRGPGRPRKSKSSSSSKKRKSKKKKGGYDKKHVSIME